MKQLIKNGRVIDPANKIDEVLDILIENNKIISVGKGLKSSGAEIINAKGKIVVPGLIDMHVHLREPGQEAKEDFSSGTKAAAAGGFTFVATMPNTKPVVDTAAAVRNLQKRATDVGVVRVAVIGALTKEQKGIELAEIGDMADAGAIAFSDDGHYVEKAKVMLNGLDYLRTFDKIIIQHAEEKSLVEEGVMNEGHRSAMLGLKGRPTVAEDIAVARDLLLAEYADAKLHIAHISSKNALSLVRQAKARGVKVTAEVTPQHLTMTEDCINLTNTSTKINPPLRSPKDTEAMIEGLIDGTIDMIVTDHSPHAQEEKDVEYAFAPSGFPGLETSLGVMLTDLYHTGLVDLPLIISKMTAEPAKVFGLDVGTLSVGALADITIIDLEKEWIVDSTKFYTKGTHSPFEGKQMKGKAVLTMVDGKIIMQDGVIVK